MWFTSADSRHTTGRRLAHRIRSLVLAAAVLLPAGLMTAGTAQAATNDEGKCGGTACVAPVAANAADDDPCGSGGCLEPPVAHRSAAAAPEPCGGDLCAMPTGADVSAGPCGGNGCASPAIGLDPCGGAGCAMPAGETAGQPEMAQSCGGKACIGWHTPTAPDGCGSDGCAPLSAVGSDGCGGDLCITSNERGLPGDCGSDGCVARTSGREGDTSDRDPCGGAQCMIRSVAGAPQCVAALRA